MFRSFLHKRTHTNRNPLVSFCDKHKFSYIVKYCLKTLNCLKINIVFAFVESVPDN